MSFLVGLLKNRGPWFRWVYSIYQGHLVFQKATYGWGLFNLRLFFGFSEKVSGKPGRLGRESDRLGGVGREPLGSWAIKSRVLKREPFGATWKCGSAW